MIAPTLLVGYAWADGGAVPPRVIITITARGRTITQPARGRTITIADPQEGA